MPLFSPTRIFRAAAGNRSTFKWGETLALPRSTFPARVSAAQLEQYRRRCADDLYAWQRANRAPTVHGHDGGEENNEFILHDGPPYANGAVHAGHALNKVLKDIIIRWHCATGKRVQYVPGWDCHGLPIELRALKEKGQANAEQATALTDVPTQEAAAANPGSMSASEIRKAAKELASETIEVQKASFREWGVMGEWDAPYLTMDPDFEVKQLGVFREMVRRGLISRHYRPVYWSPSSRTALAEAELEYDDNHTCTAAFVKLPFSRLPQVLKSNPAVNPRDISALIWTTTPWTLPANEAIAVNGDLEYTVISIKKAAHDASQHQFVVAKERVEHVLSFLAEETEAITIVDSLPGSQLADGDAACFNLFQGTESPVLQASYVTGTSGTGLVHTAPGHGMEDYQLCQQNNILDALAPIDDEGCFTADAFTAGGQGESLTGLDVQTSGVRAVLEALADADRFLPSELTESGNNLVLATHSFVHKNPIDWRTKLPVIVRATAQWFADVSAITDRALTAIDEVKFIPEGGKTRLRSFVEGRSNWCISRQRAWGVPIPAIYSKETGEPCITVESIDHIISVLAKKGTDAWFTDPADDPVWLHPSLEPGKWGRGKDTMDVWFDSGTTWTTLGGRRSDLYIEGTDQHRGWFQSSLLNYVANQDTNSSPLAPFATLVTHGFILDAEGRKMSKSIGNVIAPEQIVDGSLLSPVKQRKQNKPSKVAQKDTPTYDAMGPDVLRLWVASSDYTKDVSISVPVLQSVQQALQKYRNTFKFLIGLLNDYPHGGSDPVMPPVSALNFADKAVLHQLSITSHAVFQAYGEYRFFKAVNEITGFITADLSAFYVEVVKDRMYAGSTRVRRNTQAVLATILQNLTTMLGPITPHLVEECWEHMSSAKGNCRTNAALVDELHPLRRIWHAPFAAPWDEETADGIEHELHVFRRLSAAAKTAQEAARSQNKIGSGLACKLVIQLSKSAEPSFKDCLSKWKMDGDLSDLFVVSQAEITTIAHSEPHQAAWRFEQPIEGMNADGDSVGNVFVLPPDHQKCVRCWKYTAEEEDVPCARCRDVLAERGFEPVLSRPALNMSEE